jgi:hypothetical protein
MINFLEECEEKDLDKHYPNSSEVFTEVLGVLDQIETESFFKCREVLKNVQ